MHNLLSSSLNIHLLIPQLEFMGKYGIENCCERTTCQFIFYVQKFCVKAGDCISHWLSTVHLTKPK